MLTVVKLTIGEAARRRILWVLVALAGVAVGLTAWGVSALANGARDRGVTELDIKFAVSQVLIFIAFMFGFVLVMTAAFFGSPAIATDLESGVAQAMLARPLRRSSYLLGRWLGLAIVIVAYAAAAGFLAIGAVGLVTGYTPPDPVSPVLYLAGMALLLLTLTVFLSTRLPAIAGGAIAVVAYRQAWMAGVLGKIGLALGTTALVSLSDAIRYLLPTDALWQGVVYGLEPSFVINSVGGEFVAKSSPFFASEPPSITIVAWAGVWLVLLLALAVSQLRRREL
jgi:ABC-type transport system involved in multi-copper enzyme maturation permease subunit